MTRSFTFRQITAELTLLLGLLLVLVAGLTTTFRATPTFTIPPQAITGSLQPRGFESLEFVEGSGQAFRWTTGAATLQIPNPETSGTMTLVLAGGAGQNVDVLLRLNSAEMRFVAAPELRVYHLPLIRQPGEYMTLGIDTPTFQEPGSGRRLGVAVGEIQIVGQPGAPANLLLAVLVVTTGLYFLARATGCSRVVATLVTLLPQGGLLVAYAHGLLDTQATLALEISGGAIIGSALLGAGLARKIPVLPMPVAVLPLQRRMFGLAVADWWAVAALIGVVLLYFSPYLFSGQTLVPYDLLAILSPWNIDGTVVQNSLLSDIVRQYLPWRQLYAEALRSGELPFWNPYTFSGMPFMANLQSAIFYPLNLIFLLPSLDTAFLLFLGVHLLLSGVGMYGLLRYLQRTPIASLVAALIWMMCGVSTVWRPWLSIAATMAWLPWLVLATAIVCTRPSWRAVGGLGLTTAMLLLAGHIQFAYYCMLLAGSFAIWRVATQPLTWAKRGKRLIWYVLGTILGLAMFAPQLAATFELSRFSARGSIPIAELMSGAIPVIHLITLILPMLYGGANAYIGPGNFVEFTIYIGIASLILVLIAPLHPRLGRRSALWFFIAWAVIGLHLSFGGQLNLLAARLPLYESFRGLQRIAGIWSFGAAACAAWGIEAVLTSHGRRRQLIGAVALGCVACSLALLLRNQLGLSRIFSSIWPIHYLSDAAVWPVAALLAGSGMCLATGSLAGRLRLLTGLVPAAFVLLTLIDLVGFARSYYPVVDRTRAFPSTPGLRYLEAQRNTGRILRFGPGLLESPVLPNSALLFHIEDIDGYDSFTLDRYNRLVGLIEPARYKNVNNFNVLGNFTRVNSLASPLLDLLGAAFALSAAPIENDQLPAHWREVYSGSDMTIYRNERVLPMAFVVGRSQVADDTAQLVALGASDFAPLQVATLDIPLAVQLDPQVRGVVQVTARTLNTLTLDVTIDAAAGEQGLLIIRQNYYPGWHAWSNGVEMQLQRVDYTLQGVVLPSGRHTIELRFTPTGFWPLISLMVAALLITSVCLVRPTKPRINASEANTSTGMA